MFKIKGFNAREFKMAKNQYTTDEKVDLLFDRSPSENVELIKTIIKRWYYEPHIIQGLVIETLVSLNYDDEQLFNSIIDSFLNDEESNYRFFEDESVISNIVELLNFEQLKILQDKYRLSSRLDIGYVMRILKSNLPQTFKFEVVTNFDRYTYTHDFRRYVWRLFDDQEVLEALFKNETSYENIKYLASRIGVDFDDYCREHITKYYLEDNYSDSVDTSRSGIINRMIDNIEDESLFRNILDNGDGMNVDTRLKFYNRISDLEYLMYKAVRETSSEIRKKLVKHVRESEDYEINYEDVERIFSKERTLNTTYFYDVLRALNDQKAIESLKDKLYDDSLDVDLHSELFNRLKDHEETSRYYDFLYEWFSSIIHTQTKANHIDKRSLVRRLADEFVDCNNITSVEKDEAFHYYIVNHVDTMHETSFKNTLDIALKHINDKNILFNLTRNYFELFYRQYLNNRTKTLDITLEEILKSMKKKQFNEIFLAFSTTEELKKYLIKIKNEI